MTDPNKPNVETVWVVSTAPAKPDGGNVVAFAESDDTHPNGRVLVAGPVAVLVAKTAAVEKAIRDGVIREAEGSEKKELVTDGRFPESRDAPPDMVLGAPAATTEANERARADAERARAERDAERARLERAEREPDAPRRGRPPGS